jgi:hypothetical protein
MANALKEGDADASLLVACLLGRQTMMDKFHICKATEDSMAFSLRNYRSWK